MEVRHATTPVALQCGVTLIGLAIYSFISARHFLLVDATGPPNTQRPQVFTNAMHPNQTSKLTSAMQANCSMVDAPSGLVLAALRFYMRARRGIMCIQRRQLSNLPAYITH